MRVQAVQAATQRLAWLAWLVVLQGGGCSAGIRHLKNYKFQAPLGLQAYRTLDDDATDVLVSNITNDVYVAGVARHGMCNLKYGGSGDGYVMKYDSAGRLQWVHTVATGYKDSVTAITIQGSFLYAVGQTAGNVLGEGAGTSVDMFLAKFETRSGARTFIVQFGTAADDYGTGVAVSPTHAYVSGWSGGVGGTLTNTDPDGCVVAVAVGRLWRAVAHCTQTCKPAPPHPPTAVP